MDENFVAELTKIFQATVIHSPTSFSFAGRFVPHVEPVMHPLSSSFSSQNQIVSQLQNYLYQYCYCRKFKLPLVDEHPVATQEDGSFLKALSKANASRERWDSGWQIYQIAPSGQVLAHKHESTRLLWPGEFVTHDGMGVAPRVGMNISIFFAKESSTMQAGFYFAFGETVVDQQDNRNLVRFYWNIEGDGATDLMRAVTQILNRFQVPYRFKCLSNRAHYNRIDAAVLFVEKRFYRVTGEILLDVYRRVREHLKPETLLFTKELASGLALAEEPGNGESFGMSRCRILAEGIWNAYAMSGQQSETARWQAVTEQFGKCGVDLERPYLNSGSVYRYELPNYRG